MKKMTALLLALVLSMGYLALSHAEIKQPADTVSPLYIVIKDINSTLSINGTTASCFGKVTAMSSVYLCSVTVSLYKKTDSGWSWVTGWSGNGTGRASASGDTTVISGNQYRVTTSATIKNASGTVIEQASYYSSTEICQ